MTDTETQLKEIGQRLVQAWLSHDWATLDELLDDHWMVKLRFTDVFLKRNENWRAVASQATLLPQ